MIALWGRPGKADTPVASPEPNSSSASTSQYNYVTKPTPPPSVDPGLPQILEIDLNDQRLNAPGPLIVRVITSANTTAVYAHVEGQTFGIPAAQPGRFELAATLPTLPSYMKGRNYDFDFEAMTADGKRTHVDVPVSILP